MFCSECGAKVKEGAVFCGKCGTRLMADDVGSATPKRSVRTDTQVSSEWTYTDRAIPVGNMYDMLWENVPNCPKIKKIKFLQKEGITMLKGNKNRYFVVLFGGFYRLSVCPRILFTIHRFFLLCVILCVILPLLAAGYWEVIFHPLLSWCLLIGGVGGTISEVICKREKKVVVPFIQAVLSKTVCVEEPVVPVIDPIYINGRSIFYDPRLYLGLPLPVASLIKSIVYSIVALAGVVILTVSLVLGYWTI